MSKDDIYNLLNKYYNDKCSFEEKERLDQYLADNKVDDNFLMSVMDELLEDAKLRHDYDKENVLLNIKNELDAEKDKTVELPVTYDPKPAFKFRRNSRVLIAACFSIIFIVSFLAYNQLSKTATPLPVAQAWQEIATPRGQFRTINLPDGSSVRLNVSSRIKFRENFMAHATRSIYLEGEAYFDVASMPEKPFVIESNGVKTEVIGTSFNISAYPNQSNVYVSVVEGKVKVESVEGDKELYLLPDQMATWDAVQLERSGYDHDLILGWADQTLVFKEASFKDVVKRLENWYNVDFIIHGDIKSSGYTAKHKAKPLEVILKGLSFAGNFDYKINGKEVIIHAK